MTSVIEPDQAWALWAVLIGAAALGFQAERTRWGSRLSGAVVTILATALLSNFRIIPVSAPAYDAVWSYLVPLAIPLLLFKADIRRIVRESGPMLMVFLAGAMGTVAGVGVAFYLVPLGDEAWKLAAIFCATYIGGSMNYMAAAETVGLHSGDWLTAGAAADNLVMTLYFVLLFSLPSLAFVRRLLPERAEQQTVNPALTQSGAPGNPLAFHPLGLALALALAAASCAIGYGTAAWWGMEGGSILVITVVMVGLATAMPTHLARLPEAESVGSFLMQVFFAAIGASANVAVVLQVGPVLFVFAAVILIVHLLVIMVFGKIARVSLAEVVVASNANTGGPTTAAAMAAARGWNHLVVPAVLCGTLGYAIATFLGVMVGSWLGRTDAW